MIVQDLLRERKEIFSVPQELTVHDAARYLREHQVRAVGVLDATGKLVGAISQSDISDKVAAENKCPAWMRVSEIMTRELVTVTPRTNAGRLPPAHGNPRDFHLLVVDAAGGFCGISVADSASLDRVRS